MTKRLGGEEFSFLFVSHLTFIVILPRNVFLSMTWKFSIEVMLESIDENKSDTSHTEV